MENKFGLTDLSENELKECNGGRNVIISLVFSFRLSKRLIDFVEGLRKDITCSTNM